MPPAQQGRVSHKVFRVSLALLVLKGLKVLPLVPQAHKEFKELDLVSISRLTRGPACIVDARNVVDPVTVARLGLAYRGVGRPGQLGKSSPASFERAEPAMRVAAKGSESGA